MCSLSWRRERTGYELVFSRDEQRSRTLARPPAIVRGARLEFLAPSDPAGGGTWILLNAFGLAVCVLNGPENPASARPSRGAASRGGLPLAAAGAACAAECEPFLRGAFAVEKFRPVSVFAFDPSGHRGWSWDGCSLRELAVDIGVGFISSSSFDGERIVAAREGWHRTWVTGLGRAPGGDDLWQFHLDADRCASAETVRMSRADAHTVSLTRVIVRPGQREIIYATREADGGFSEAHTYRVAPVAGEAIT